MMSAIVGGLIGVVGSLCLFYLDRYYRTKDLKKKERIEKEILTFRERDSEQKIDKEFIFSLPKLKSEVYKNCHKNWDTGITLNMIKGNEDLIWFLRFCWLSLARFYPENYFSKKGHNTYIDEYIIERTNYHYSMLEAGDTQKNGTIAKVRLGGAIANDLDKLIVDLVEQILSFDDPRKNNWFEKWNSR